MFVNNYIQKQPQENVIRSASFDCIRILGYHWYVTVSFAVGILNEAR